MDVVRAGITLYGLGPSDEVERDIIDLKPLMTLRSHIVYIKSLEKGRQISYGGTFEVKEAMRVAATEGRDPQLAQQVLENARRRQFGKLRPPVPQKDAVQPRTRRHVERAA